MRSGVDFQRQIYKTMVARQPAKLFQGSLGDSHGEIYEQSLIFFY